MSNQYKLHRLITNQFYLFKHLKIALGDHPPPKMERLPQFRSSGSTSNWSFYCKDKPFQTISLSFSQIIVGSLPPSGTQCQILCVFPNLVAKVSPLPSPQSHIAITSTPQLSRGPYKQGSTWRIWWYWQRSQIRCYVSQESRKPSTNSYTLNIFW